ncbi:hypothetical protein CYLTODRAFT_423661 [Cylindrobasidium torrendii FP15055 ss-10]|uniref:Uncharacterized protein n=1 Tax=Cylindrobasidium torrendii FP15055 ss-10 TaxID=1314674 RepID=A0A0D7B6G4_9AGAR|nr:hypothetical protein CYLTODRAFT_423661 [Cylindrobasidium torrendii FP15055 ss-10]
MNGYEGGDLSLNTGHLSNYGQTAYPTPGPSAYPDFTSPSPTNQYTHSLANGLDMTHQMQHTPQQNSWNDMYPLEQRLSHQMPPPSPMLPSPRQPQQQFQQWNATPPPSLLHEQHRHQQHRQSLPNMLPNQMRGMPMPVNGGGGVQYSNNQMMQDPASAQRRDEEVLLRTLAQATIQRVSFKEALNRLHGTHGHAANLWKDYYLENKYRLDNQLNNFLSKRQAKIKMEHHTPGASPIPSHVSSQSQIPMNNLAMNPFPMRQPSQPQEPLPTTISPAQIHIPPAARSTSKTDVRRSTNPVQTAPPPPSTASPNPGSRSPSPPTLILPSGRGNKFTPQDKDFFIKFITRRLKQDPSLTRNDLCDLLAEKAPHHSSQSWGSHWAGNHELPDKILAEAKGEVPESEMLEDDEDKPKAKSKPKAKPTARSNRRRRVDDSDEEEEAPLPAKRAPARRRPSYREISSDEEVVDEPEDDYEETDGLTEDMPWEDDADYREEQDDDHEFPEFDEKSMGRPGGPYTESDFAILARYIATYADFSAASHQEKWATYHKNYPQRTAKAWSDYYRRNDKGLEKLAQRIRQRVPPVHGTTGNNISKRKSQDDAPGRRTRRKATS